MDNFCIKCGDTDNRTKVGLDLCARCYEISKRAEVSPYKSCKRCGKRIYFTETYCADCTTKYRKRNYEGSECTRVDTCKYRTWCDAKWHCGYFLHTDELRGCPAGNCNRYVEGEAIEGDRKQLRMPAKKIDAMYR